MIWRAECVSPAGPEWPEPRRSSARSLGLVLASGDRRAVAYPVVAPGRTGLGVALDIGTTTLAAAIYDLSDGRRRATASALNPQTPFGHDIMTRVSRALDGDAEAMRASVAEEVSRLVHRLLESAGGSASGRARGRGQPDDDPPASRPGRHAAGLAPYEGALADAVESTRRRTGAPGSSRPGRVHRRRRVSAFVGADAVAGVVSTGLAGRDYPALLIDLGTNGELVLRGRAALLAASAAAGPALEGVSISSGMRAETGRDRARPLRRRASWASRRSTATPARGICGSGLLDAIAAMLDAGVLDADGRMHRRGAARGDRVVERDAGDRGSSSPTGVYLTQQDVRQVQLAKARGGCRRGRPARGGGRRGGRRARGARRRRIRLPRRARVARAAGQCCRRSGRIASRSAATPRSPARPRCCSTRPRATARGARRRAGAHRAAGEPAGLSSAGSSPRSTSRPTG